MHFVHLCIYPLTADQQNSVMKSNKMKTKDTTLHFNDS